MASTIAGAVLLALVARGARRHHEQLRPQPLVDVGPAPRRLHRGRGAGRRTGGCRRPPAAEIRIAAALAPRLRPRERARRPDRQPVAGRSHPRPLPAHRPGHDRHRPLRRSWRCCSCPRRIVATTAVGAVVIGFALQDTLGNLFAGLAIQIEKPFRVGHWVTIGGKDGMVSEITWRATKIRTKAGNFVDRAEQRAVARHDHELLGADARHAGRSRGRRQLRHAAERGQGGDSAALVGEPLIAPEPKPEVLLVDFAASAITYRIRVWTTDFAADERVRDRIRRASTTRSGAAASASRTRSRSRSSRTGAGPSRAERRARAVVRRRRDPRRPDRRAARRAGAGGAAAALRRGRDDCRAKATPATSMFVLAARRGIGAAGADRRRGGAACARGRCSARCRC